MAIGIAIRDERGITHWAPFSARKDRMVDSARAIAREFNRGSKPRLGLACDPTGQQAVQVRRISTFTRDVTCMACATLL